MESAWLYRLRVKTFTIIFGRFLSTCGNWSIWNIDHADIQLFYNDSLRLLLKQNASVLPQFLMGYYSRQIKVFRCNGADKTRGKKQFKHTGLSFTTFGIRLPSRLLILERNKVTRWTQDGRLNFGHQKLQLPQKMEPLSYPRMCINIFLKNN